MPVLWNQYPHIMGWEKISAWDHPTPSILGGNSSYVSEQYYDNLLAQFPQTRAHVITGADHWVHAGKPDAVLRAIHRYLSDQRNWLKTQRPCRFPRVDVGVTHHADVLWRVIHPDGGLTNCFPRSHQGHGQRTNGPYGIRSVRARVSTGTTEN